MTKLAPAFFLLLFVPALAQDAPPCVSDCLILQGATSGTFMTREMLVSIERRYYVWEPKDDITARELALALGAIMPNIAERSPFRSHIEMIDRLPAEAKRHFREVKN